jgi:hypothetical protein
MLIRIRSVFTVACIGIWAGVAAAAELNTPANLVVMVRARQTFPTPIDPNTPSSIGAGIVMSQTNERTVILTACHVVKPQPGYQWGISVEFKPLLGREFNAETYDCEAGESDYAVLFGYVPTLPVKGQSLRLIGHGSSNVWAERNELIVDEAFTHRIVLRTKLAKGTSGGALFDAKGQLVGMARASTGVEGMATPIQFLVDKMKANKIEVALQPAASDAKPLLATDCSGDDPLVDPCLFRR